MIKDPLRIIKELMPQTISFWPGTVSVGYFDREGGRKLCPIVKTCVDLDSVNFVL